MQLWGVGEKPLGDNERVHQDSTLHFIPAGGAFDKLLRGAQATQRMVASKKLPVFAAKVIALVISGGEVREQVVGGGKGGLVEKLQHSASLQQNLQLFINASGLPGTSLPDAGTSNSGPTFASGTCGSAPTKPPWTPESFAEASNISYKSLKGYHHNNARATLRKTAKLLKDMIDDYTREDMPFESYLVEHYTTFETYVLDNVAM